MLIIDAQVHAYERNHPGRPWHKILTGPPEVTGDQMVAAMDAVGVDGAILVSPFTMYRYDASYALEVKKRHPGRFALIKAVDPTNPAIADVIAEWKRAPDAVAVRMLLVRGGYTEDPADPGHVGHGLDPRGEVSHLRARRRCLSCHRPHFGERQGQTDGRHARAHLWLVAPAVVILVALITHDGGQAPFC